MKLTFLILIALLSTNGITISNALARDYIDFNEFIQLPKENQRQLIKTAQILLADYEQVHIDKILRSRKYKTVQQALNLLIDSAYAYDNPDLILPEGSQRLCIYAGWISYMKGGLCQHPLNVEIKSNISNTKEAVEKNKDLYKRLQKVYDMQKLCKHKGTGPEAMICNPKLFGKKLNNEPFCSVGDKNPYNSSFGCLQEVNKYAEAEGARSGKGKVKINEMILDKIISKGISNDNRKDLDSLSNLLLMNYDICMCKGQGKFIDAGYADKMFNRRTCYAWLHQTKEILGRIKSKSCRDMANAPYQKSKANDTENIYSMYDWANKALENIESNLLVNSSNSDEYFDYKVRDDAKWENTRANINLNCPIEMNETIAAVPINSGENVLITAAIVQIQKIKGHQPQKGWRFKPELGDCTEPEGGIEIDSDVTGNNKNTFKKLKDCSYKVVISRTEADVPGEVIINIDPVGKKQVLPCTINFISDTRKLKTTGPVTAEENEVSTVLKDGEVDGQLDLKVTPNFPAETQAPDMKGATIIWSKNVNENKEERSKASYTNKKVVEVTVKMTLTSGDEYTCHSTIPEVTKEKDKEEDKDAVIDDSIYSLELSQEDDGDDKVNVTVVVKKDGTEVTNLAEENLTIDWTKVIKAKEDDNEKETDKDDGIDNSSETNTNEVIEEGSNDLVKNIKRKLTDQVVNAILIKNSEEEIGSKDVTIKPLEEKSKEEKTEEKDNLPNNNPTFKQSQKGNFIQKVKGKFWGNH